MILIQNAIHLNQNFEFSSNRSICLMVNHSAVDQWVLGSRLDIADNVFCCIVVYSLILLHLDPWVEFWSSSVHLLNLAVLIIFRSSPNLSFWERWRKKQFASWRFLKIKFYNYFYDVLWTRDDQQLCFRFFCRKNRVYPIMLPQIGGEILCETLVKCTFGGVWKIKKWNIRSAKYLSIVLNNHSSDVLWTIGDQ